MSISPPPPPQPLALDVERLAIAMAAANGVLWMKASPELRLGYRIASNGALMFLGMGASINAHRHLSTRLDAIVEAVRRCAVVMDSATDGTFREADIQAMFAHATEAEMVSRVLRGLPELEPVATAEGLDGLEDEVGAGELETV